MRTSIKLMTGAALLMLGATGAMAQQATNYDYMVTGEGENRMVMSRSGGEGMRILPSADGQRPGECPNGTFYSRGENSVASCDDDTVYDMTAPESGMMMDDGQAFAEGSMILNPQTPAPVESQNSTGMGTGGDPAGTGGASNSSDPSGDAGGGSGTGGSGSSGGSGG